jgi:hypothetical protein
MLPLVIAAALAAAGPPPAPLPEPAEVAAARLLLRATAAEPTAEDVQRAAAAAAAPPPGTWDARARLAALVPHVSADARFDQRRARVVGLTGSSEVDYLRDTPGYVVGIRLSWDLPALVFANAELPAVAHLQALARARAEAVARATKLYFERQRLRLELAAAPRTDARGRAEQELRLLELAAELDALTAGAFTGSAR